ncbi:OmpA family protein [Martelella mediterranea]|uniref:Outer membrane protein OmpA-like peptidoglycan-associated protein n=1 Tax=Martelella mediterranea TaxID=293089 RepID=A0A4R3P0E4_9HYPH|nr:OmpA family protein [Martelella mediterranea]TCT39092.1 outer membrane protein OmpA-like peptidoglycan-associated protein [Martelella mediterranea]
MLKKLTLMAFSAALLAGCASSGSSDMNAADEVVATTVTVSDVGDYMDQQEAEFRQQLKGTGVTIIRTKNYLVIVMPSSITFASDKYNVVPEFYPALDTAAALLRKYSATNIDVNGYTDSTGSDAHNLKLSQQRANSVAGYLIQQGVSPQRIMPVGYGEADPVATNSTKEGRAENRRVEIKIAPPKPASEQMAKN